MSSIIEQLASDMTRAMKARDKDRLETIRYLRSVIQREEKNITSFSNDDALNILTQEAKKRREAAELYRNASRPDMAQKEENELTIITEYLPTQLSETEVIAIIDQLIAQTGASSKSDMGKIMGPLMSQIKGRFDGKHAKSLTMQRLP